MRNTNIIQLLRLCSPRNAIVYTSIQSLRLFSTYHQSTIAHILTNYYPNRILMYNIL